jgi:predicted ATPase/class 3 adenylate cyclase
MSLSAYLPQDRRRALARGASLPDRAQGAVLFADISGFTPFAKALRRRLGARRGAEELSRALDAVYTALIAEVEGYGGSVTGFAGDAIFCWFDGARDEGRGTKDERLTTAAVGRRAVACAARLQQAMAALRAMPLPDGAPLELSLKVAVALGDGRRFVVGDHDHYRLDLLAGRTVVRAAAAEQLAGPGEIVVDEAAVGLFGDDLTITAWRVAEATGERFAVVAQVTADIPPLPPEPIPHLPAAVLQNWLHPRIWQRGQSGHAALLTEFRPCAALFFRFSGIDYDSPAAAMQLDAVVRLIQQVAARYDGLLIDLTLGEKGSYAYLNFGALNVHENNPHRAVKAALTLTESAREFGFLEPTQIGLTQGTLRVGPYGGPTRRHYGALGDEVNQAARLMQAAAPGQILADAPVWRATADQFQAVPQPPLTLKGIAEPIQSYAINGERPSPHIQLLEPTYALPMVGRQAELETIAAQLDLVQAGRPPGRSPGRSQIVAVTGEAGLGKSRLLAEAIRLAYRRGFVGYGGACQSDGRDSPYLPWRPIWRGIFGLDGSLTAQAQTARLTAVLQQQFPHRLDALPLLGRLLDLPIQENEFTIQLTPQYRQSALHVLLEEALRWAAQATPLLIVLEDLHWLDPLSHDLLDALAGAVTAHPVCFLLAYRPPELLRLQTPRLENRPNFTALPLTELSWAEGAQLARAKLVQLYPDDRGALYTALVNDLLARAQGNPFFLEELLNYLRDQEIEPRELTDGRRLELPDSLHTLVLSRIDQLPVRQKMIVRAASVIGRSFFVKWLVGYYPALGEMAQVQADLAELHTLDLTLLDASKPELAYLFKHIIIHEVTYESLPFATRARLHEQLAAYLEEINAPLDSIAYHYGQSDNRAKKLVYWQQAAEAAQANYANESALIYYDQLLTLLEDSPRHIDILLKRGTVLETIGSWGEAEAAYRAALALARAPLEEAGAQFALGKLCRLRGDFAEALGWLAEAQAGYRAEANDVGLGQTLIEMSMVHTRQQQFGVARPLLQEGVALANRSGDKKIMHIALNGLGNLSLGEGDYPTAQKLYEETIALRRELGDKGSIVLGLLNNLALTTLAQGEIARTRAILEEALESARGLGHKQLAATILGNLGTLAFSQEEYERGEKLVEEALELTRELGDKLNTAIALIMLGYSAFIRSDYVRAKERYEEGLVVSKSCGEKQSISSTLLGLGLLALVKGDVAQARRQIIASLQIQQHLVKKETALSCLIALASAALAEGQAVRCTLILGAVTAAQQQYELLIELVVRALHEETLAKVKAQLGEAVFQQAWDEGAQWTLEEATAYALDWTAVDEAAS